MEALFGCPLEMPTDDAINTSHALTISQRYIICDTLLYCVEWLRCTINNFCEDIEDNHRYKLVERVNQLVATEETLYSLIQSNPEYIELKCPSHAFQYYNPKTGKKATSAAGFTSSGVVKLSSGSNNKSNIDSTPAGSMSDTVDEPSTDFSKFSKDSLVGGSSRNYLLLIPSIASAVGALIAPLEPQVASIIGYSPASGPPSEDNLALGETEICVENTFADSLDSYVIAGDSAAVLTGGKRNKLFMLTAKAMSRLIAHTADSILEVLSVLDGSSSSSNIAKKESLLNIPSRPYLISLLKAGVFTSLHFTLMRYDLSYMKFLRLYVFVVNIYGCIFASRLWYLGPSNR